MHVGTIYIYIYCANMHAEMLEKFHMFDSIYSVIINALIYL